MRPRHIAPFLLLFAWQIASTRRPDDRPSRLQFWLGSGVSSFDVDENIDCNGRRYVETEETDGGGVRVDGWPSPSVRVSGAVTTMRGTKAPLGLVAWEAKAFGAGAGWSGGPDRVGYEGPSAYLRFGPLDRVHLRAELRTPTSMPGVTGWARAGVAISPQRHRGGGFFFGVAAVKGCSGFPCPQPRPPLTTDKLDAFAELTLAFGRSFGVFGAGHLGEHTRGVGVGMMLRVAR